MVLYSNVAHIIDWQASDVLAVELLQKDARLSVSGELGRPCPGGTYDDNHNRHYTIHTHMHIKFTLISRYAWMQGMESVCAFNL